LRTFFLLLTVAALAGCQKHDDTPADASKVSISLLAPQAGAQYKKGDTVHVSADVSYPAELHGYELELADSASGTALWNKDSHVHDDHFSIRESWVDTLSSRATLLLTLTVEIDHDGHDTDRVIRLYSRP
jgi:hypothetical protein